LKNDLWGMSCPQILAREGMIYSYDNRHVTTLTSASTLVKTTPSRGIEIEVQRLPKVP
jgi:hypothetical protein